MLKDFRAQMAEAAENLQFEKAAALRDKIQAVEKILESQKSCLPPWRIRILWLSTRKANQTAIQIFFVRSGKLISAEHHVLEDTDGMERKKWSAPI